MSRVGSDSLLAIAGRVGSGQRFAGSGRVGSKKSDPWTTLDQIDCLLRIKSKLSCYSSMYTYIRDI